MTYLLNHTVNSDDEQPIVLVTALTGSATYQIGGSTIELALLLYDQSGRKLSWQKMHTCVVKLEHLMLSLTDEISMVGLKNSKKLIKLSAQLKVKVMETLETYAFFL